MLKFYQRPFYEPTYSITTIDESTICLTMTDFLNPDAIVSLMNQHQDLLNKQTTGLSMYGSITAAAI